MRILVLFDGNGCVSKALRKMGHDVRTLDILSFEHINYAMDILLFEISMLDGWIPDTIWASPPCETFSIVTGVKGGGNLYWETVKIKGKVDHILPRTNFSTDKRLKFPERITTKRELHTRLLIKTIKLINQVLKSNPNLIWCIENPASGFMKHYIPNIQTGVIPNVVTYCKYGSSYRKETNIFSNVKLNLEWCPTKHKRNNNTCHHTDSLHRRNDHRKQKDGVVIPKTYLERSAIPTKLCEEIFTQIENILQYAE